LTPDLAALLRAAAATLPGETPRLDAELLLADAMGVARDRLILGGGAPDPAALARFEALLERRRRHEPVAHILGHREFWSLTLRVTPDVLIPRPDSETLVAAALEARRSAPPVGVLDLGTGSGALLLALLSEWPAARGVGVDRSLAAVQVARENARRLGMAGRADWLVADWADALDGRFDVVLCNPPYVPAGAAVMPDVARHEPASALYAGPDGLAAFRRLLPQLPRLLAAGGVAVLEFGAGQGDALVDLARAVGLVGETRADLAGRPRALVLRRG
jgi:release factor glutamine methyltransferase